MVKKVLKWAGICAGVVLLAVAGLVLWLTITEYKPAAVEDIIDVKDSGAERSLTVGDSFTVLSQNTGYCGLGADSDFFMDGGKSVKPTKDQINANVAGIGGQLEELTPDVCFLQEVDDLSDRSYHTNQRAFYYSTVCDGGNVPCADAYALNYCCNFVPYPLPPIGKVRSGLQIISVFPVQNAQRIALPCPFSWPVSAANLKRCLLVSNVPLDGSDKKLVLVNLHLEAYDDGDGKATQTKALMDFLTGEYEKGNYVIAGGDFNQTFPGALDAFPIKDPSLWAPGVLEDDVLPDGWQFACDLSTPSCRLLNQPYDPDSGNTQFYVIDGFILSPNIRLDRVETIDCQFQYTDHNPVLAQVTLEADALQ